MPNGTSTSALQSGIKVALASELSVLREGMRRILLKHDDIHIVAEAAHYHEFLTDDASLSADVLVLIAQPATSVALDGLVHMRGDRPSLSVIMIVQKPGLPQVLSILRSGVRGLIDAAGAASQLPAAVRAVATGRLYLHEDVARLVTSGSKEINTDHTHTALTEREFEIFLRMAAGQKPLEIGATLGISTKTVSTHKSRLMEKMRMSSDAEIVRYAIANGLLN
ncbi:response regulator transcription factor [Massilia sp. 9I]|uniref:response regulator transcription factor n=1 Tax=Massilia sp. 9I TaxID=2653152 RepID=UPI0012EEED70|nr:response regulator transcription factor [Massilia sp. 9I]VXB89273.1 putative DNA-binding response regulator [Massilia sp. 9I]